MEAPPFPALFRENTMDLSLSPSQRTWGDFFYTNTLVSKQQVLKFFQSLLLKKGKEEKPFPRTISRAMHVIPSIKSSRVDFKI